MAVYTYTSDDIQFSTFDIWSNAGYTDDTDINLSAVSNEMYPSLGLTDISVSDFNNRSLFYGSATPVANGTVEVTAPYTQAASSSTIVIKNVDFSIHTTLTLVATGTYPYTFSEWRDAAGGGGTQISTNATLSLTAADYTSVQVFYAYFV